MQSRTPSGGEPAQGQAKPNGVIRRFGWVAFGFLLAAGSVVAAVILKVNFSFGPVVESCYVNTEIDADERNALEGVARRFVDTLLGASSKDAYGLMSSAGRASTNADQIKTVAAQLKSESETSPPTITRTLFIDGLFGAPTMTKIPCELRGAGGPELASFSSTPKEAHVLLTEGLENATRIFEVWLERDDGRWSVKGFSADYGSLGGRDGDTWWGLAKEQRARGHLFNATFLYIVAKQTLDRGAYYQLPAWAEFSNDFDTFKPPPELLGSGPYRWTLNGRRYDITKAEIDTLVGGKTVLVIYQPSLVWKGLADADSRNRKTITAFLLSHPEWTETFNAIVVRSAVPGSGQSYGTVYENGKGYSPGPSRR